MLQSLSSQVLRSFLALTEHRSTLRTELAKIEAEIESTFLGRPTKAGAKRRGRPPGAKKTTAKKKSKSPTAILKSEETAKTKIARAMMKAKTAAKKSA